MRIIQLNTRKNGQIPNNDTLPVILYKNVLKLQEEEDNEAMVRDIFQYNHWSNAWVDGIYNYHHYHSNTHEVISVLKGKCTVMLGGEKGAIYKLEKGDVLILPAGVGHKMVEASGDFRCLGAYPNGMEYDMNYGKPEEHPAVDENIARTPLPDHDPVYGLSGPLREYWKEKSNKNKHFI